MKPIKNILFDFGGVIVGLNKNNAIKRFKEIGVANIEDYLNEFRQTGIFLALEEGKLSLNEFYAELQKLAGREISEEDMDSAWMAFLTGVDEYKFQMLKDLRKKYNVYLLSNTNPVIMGWAESSQFSPTGEPITAFFDKCYYSFKIGAAKPDKEIFEYVIRDSGINPEESLFLDDGPANLEAAKTFGLQTYLANQNEDLRKIFDLN
ncbi:HAD superfamily hydrolase (TIGR01509 family) [Dysgonomonas sp. PH5-45]|uniref:HAD family hydrolase n=1 Tax=unclassified Dysgonomonas TaxID=2630389 RepID=UPI0024766A41|nr:MULTISPECIES: HAD family phosphatase [unclassified Dysgonomonas]MDH6354130.1 HAD superfamily hydrolase (TIGR01509 family) [Dysgonomonas sp. PH5-45]MDH6387019.1 HAD superfamily hydrolase (TIGR01509 family) [Dysgonomonas sp. PH5-37]